MSSNLRNELVEQKSNNDNKAKIYAQQLSEENERFYLILEDFKRFFISSKMNPDSHEAQNAFQREKSMIQDNHKQLFLLNNDVQKSTSEIKEQINILEKSLRKERKSNKSLTKKEQSLENLDNAAVQMLKDTNFIYNQRLITIFNVVVGIVATSVLVYKIPSA